MAAVRKVYPEIVRLLLLAGASIQVGGVSALEALLSAGPQSSTDAERAIRQMLTGDSDASTLTKAALLAEVADHEREADQRREASSAAEAQRKAAARAESALVQQIEYQRQLETRRLQRPHASVAVAWGAPSGTPLERTPATGGAAAAADDATVRADAAAAVAGADLATKPLPKSAAAPANGTSDAAPRRAGLPWEVAPAPRPYHPLDESEARKRAAWRQHWDPLQGRTRPDATEWTHRSRWDRKLQCWVEAAAPPPLHERQVSDPVSTLSGFQHHVNTLAEEVHDVSVTLSEY